jgi:hypothetical protein
VGLPPLLQHFRQPRLLLLLLLLLMVLLLLQNASIEMSTHLGQGMSLASLPD